MNWQENLKVKVSLDEPLARHTTFKIGGPARFFAAPCDCHDLQLLLVLAKKEKIPVLILGAGSNILVGDKGVKALVIKLNSGCFKQISVKENLLEAGCGVGLSALLLLAKKHSLGGLEFLAGIPGTVGGALAMNAGAHGKGILEFVERVRVMDYNGRQKFIPAGKIKFGYRKSCLDKYIILGAVFRLSKSSPCAMQADIKKYLGKRAQTQDVASSSAGCVFKNPPGESAGRLIDLCGLKGVSCGGASVSMKHANFILNKKRAQAGDVLQLISLIKRRVKGKFKLDLQPEIKIWR
jgi:UDP-N-acetylmuramate dehydrogenase